MTDCSDPTGPGDARGGAEGAQARLPAAEGRLVALWHRVRSGEDPWAFGAVVIVAALVLGLLWFWAGARHGGVAAASASPGPSHGTGARATARAPQSPRSGDEGSGPSFEAGDEGSPADPAPTTTGPALAVHVAGAVAHAGLYHLPGGSRVADAIAAAGGNLARADVDRLNLAARLDDGQRVYVVRRGEPPPPGPVASGLVDGATGAEGEAGASGPAGPVDLNTADLDALDTLPGVGPATARAILEERVRRGGFRSTRDLLRVPGIGEGRFARLKAHVRV